MAIRIFKSFVSTVTPFLHRNWDSQLKLLVDPTTGAPVGIATPNANGPDGIWTPIDITAAQAISPTAAMLADLNAVYRLNAVPYTRYYSNGLTLESMSGGDDVTVQGPNGLFGNMVVYAPLTITDKVAIQGTVHVINFAA